MFICASVFIATHESTNDNEYRDVNYNGVEFVDDNHGVNDAFNEYTSNAVIVVFLIPVVFIIIMIFFMTMMCSSFLSVSVVPRAMSSHLIAIK